MKKIFLALMAGILIFCVVRYRYEAFLQRRYAEKRHRSFGHAILKRVRLPAALLDDLAILFSRQCQLSYAGLYNWIAIEAGNRLQKRLYVLDHGHYSLADLSDWTPSANHLYFCIVHEEGYLCTGDRLWKILKDDSAQKAIYLFSLDSMPTLCHR